MRPETLLKLGANGKSPGATWRIAGGSHLVRTSGRMEKNRLEAFSDGVIAIILTIMVLDLKLPKEHTFDALVRAWPMFGAYSLSYWNIFLLWLHHHAIFSPLKEITRAVLTANGLLLFVASFIPFATAFASETHWTEPVPVVLYGLLMACVSAAFVHLRSVARSMTPDSNQATRHSTEVRLSLLMGLGFLVGAGAAWFDPRLALVLYASVPLLRVAYRRKSR